MGWGPYLRKEKVDEDRTVQDNMQQLLDMQY